MKKTYYYKFLPTKAEEEAAKPNTTIFQVGRVLVEIRDLYPAPVTDPKNPWQIKKVATSTDILTGKLMLLHHDVFEYIFRHWSMEMCSHVVAGNKLYAVIWDLTDETSPVRYHNENIYFEKGPQDTYLLGWMDLARKANMNPNDEIGLYWENRSGTFQFKVLHRRI
ncbi:hypothetical protein AAG906_039026 [Vitis piasezkii]|uniref:B3 domain-containing protein n=2 Tax=Vitis vinifera TaxID=29760 RepID=A5AVC2_VITVI|nr:hypothetical protein CK203_028309 [Vitis vinifera]CAN78362.1 hypothetical protein VITISV_008736 [Vitis vinifera]